MASTTARTSPQTNLKDRIAALQRLNQQNHSPSNSLTPNAALGPPASVSLRDKIAKFEQRGGTPIPRGSFGMGAPPAGDGTSRKKGELYGNRVPGLNRPNGPPPTISKSRSPLNDSHTPSAPSSPRKRCFSTSGLDFSLDEARMEMSSGFMSSNNAVNVPSRISILEAAMDGNSPLCDSFPDSGFHSATSSPRRNSMVIGRRAASDSYGSYGFSSPVPTQDDEVAEVNSTTESQVLEPLKEDPITEMKQSSSEPDPIGNEPDAVAQVAMGTPVPTPVVEMISLEPPKVQVIPSSNTDTNGPSSPTPIPDVTHEASQESSAKLDVEVFPTGLGRIDSQIEEPVLKSDTRVSACDNPPTPVDPASTVSLEFAPVTLSVSEGNTNTVSGDGSFTFEMSQAGIATAHTEGLSSVMPGVAPPPSPPPSTPTLDLSANPSPKPSRSHSDLKQAGDLQPKLRKKLYPNSGPSFQELSLAPKPGRKSFSAVVHRNGRDSMSSARKSNDFGAATVLSIHGVEPSIPQSPITGDLARLAAEAALLERQLGDWSSNDEYSEPDYSVPLFTRPKPTFPYSSPPVPELVCDDASSEQTDPTQSMYSVPYPIPTVRQVGEEGKADFVPSMPAKNTRSRKLSSRIKSLANSSTSTLRSLSSSHSRPSLSSEMSSTESTRGVSSLLVGQGDGNNSGSSSKRLTPPKKNPLSRATSFADRLINRSGKTKSTFLGDSQDNNHLSPSRINATSRSKGSPQRGRSASSHSQIPRLRLPKLNDSPLPSLPPSLSTPSSPRSSAFFDGDLFDAFPPVPQDLPRPLPQHASTSTLSLPHFHNANTAYRSSQTLRNA